MTLDPLALLREEMEAAGLRLEWLGDVVSFAGPSELVTPGMRAVLDAFRDELSESVPKPPVGPRRPREWKYASGQVSTEELWWEWPHDYHAAGAWHWRYAGETKWRLTPNGERYAGVTDEEWFRFSDAERERIRTAGRILRAADGNAQVAATHPAKVG